MKKIILAIAVFMFSNSANLFAQQDILGTWLVQDKDAHVEIYKDGDKYFGKIVWLKKDKEDDGSERVDKNNPDKSLRSRKMMGMINLKDFVWNGEEMEDGTIYSPKKGKTYDSKMWMEGDKLRVRGYIGFFFKTQLWTRVK